MNEMERLSVILIILILTTSITGLCIANPAPVQQYPHLIDGPADAKQFSPNSNGSLILTNSSQIPFKFKDWGTYSGYVIGSKQYFQRYSSPSSESCFDMFGYYLGLQSNWVSEVLIDDNHQWVVSSQQSLDLKEGYTLAIKSFDIKGNKLYLELMKNNVPVHHEVLKVVEDPANPCENTYYFETNIKCSQQNDFDILIAVHFKYAFKGLDNEILSIVDGIWQISETARQKCNSDVCIVGALCDNGRCTCPEGQMACNGSCIPMGINNCGSCGNVCLNGKVCNNGRCTCPDGETECSGKCIDTLNDNDSCGSCGNICPVGALCDNGQCTCPEGQMVCNGSCISMDINNCGSCGNICPVGALCDNSQCICPEGQMACNGSCISIDINNCGSCGNICPVGALCDNSQCICPEGQIACNGSCISMDINNCGSCGNVCLNGKVCNNGRCTCPDGETECSGKCIDTLNDNDSCGSCGNICPVGALCDNGQCTCPEEQIVCNGSCISMDINNCGSCGNVCLNGKVCNNGRCTCPDGETECGGKCIDTLNDNNNCRSCDLICLPCSSCIEGNCIPAGTGKQKIVDKNDPNAYHSIQDAVNATQDCDIILVKKGFYKENINIKNKASMNKSLMIIGEGEGQTIIDGGNSQNDPVVFLQGAGLNQDDVPLTTSVTLADMTIQNGNSQSDGISGGKGGGIAANPRTNLTVKDCKISWNKANNGGGIYTSGIYLTVIGCTISQNTAKSQNTGGGGIYQGSPCIIKRSIITDNSASIDGGGILCDENLTIQKSTIIGNSVPSDCQGADVFVKGSVKLNYDEESTLGDVFPPT